MITPKAVLREFSKLRRQRMRRPCLNRRCLDAAAAAAVGITDGQLRAASPHPARSDPNKSKRKDLCAVWSQCMQAGLVRVPHEQTAAGTSRCPGGRLEVQSGTDLLFQARHHVQRRLLCVDECQPQVPPDAPGVKSRRRPAQRSQQVQVAWKGGTPSHHAQIGLLACG